MITFDFTKNEKQREYFDAVMLAVAGHSSKRIFAYGGAVRGGKTYVTLLILYFLAKKFPGSRWHVIRATHPRLTATTIPSWQKLIPSTSKSIERFYDTPGNTRVKFKNGSEIFFVAENYTQDKNLDWMLGLETNGIFLEQAEELHEKSFQRSLERVGSWYIDPMPPALIFMTFNPTRDKAHWVRSDIYERYVKGELPETYYYMPALPTDNPYITKDQWQAWEMMDPITRKRMIEGDWDAIPTDSPWLYQFNEQNHTAKGLEIDFTLPIYVSFDFNVDPITCIFAQHGKGWIHVIEETRIENSNIWELAKRVAVKLFTNPERIPTVKITGDFSGANRTTLGNNYEEIRKEFNKHLKEIGANFQYQQKIWNKSVLWITKNPWHVDSQTHCNSILYGHPEVLIDADKCPYLISDCMLVEGKPSGEIDKGSRSDPKKQADLLDCFRYYLHNFHRNWAKEL